MTTDPALESRSATTGEPRPDRAVRRITALRRTARATLVLDALAVAGCVALAVVSSIDPLAVAVAIILLVPFLVSAVVVLVGARVRDAAFAWLLVGPACAGTLGLLALVAVQWRFNAF